MALKGEGTIHTEWREGGLVEPRFLSERGVADDDGVLVAVRARRRNCRHAKPRDVRNRQVQARV